MRRITLTVVVSFADASRIAHAVDLDNECTRQAVETPTNGELGGRAKSALLWPCSCSLLSHRLAALPSAQLIHPALQVLGLCTTDISSIGSSVPRQTCVLERPSQRLVCCCVCTQERQPQPDGPGDRTGAHQKLPEGAVQPCHDCAHGVAGRRAWARAQ